LLRVVRKYPRRANVISIPCHDAEDVIDPFRPQCFYDCLTRFHSCHVLSLELDALRANHLLTATTETFDEL